ncbi:MAG TPA: hypothetical protein VED01_26525 [Burkholderiales bacterium]|nr:hypothetical protein [Burkholderiales bacterium]
MLAENHFSLEKGACAPHPSGVQAARDQHTGNSNTPHSFASFTTGLWRPVIGKHLHFLHSFSPGRRSAIIQVAEGDIPEGAFSSVRYRYSWRRWNLIENREIAVLKRCESPFDPL